MSTTLKNIKIAYPTEGVVRSAQLNDTVCPENSVQSAVNANFDRVGAIQTRPGMTEYADDLVGQIKSLGKLNNTVIPDGLENMEALGDETEVDTYSGEFSLCKIDDTHAIYFKRGTGDPSDTNAGTAQVVEINNATGEITPLGTPLEFDAAKGRSNKCLQIDSTHFINIWSSSSDDGKAQVFSVNTLSWDISAIGSPLTFESGFNYLNDLVQVDSNHFMAFWVTTTESKVQILEVNLSTWAVTAKDSALVYQGSNATVSSAHPLGDGQHVINFWCGTSLHDFAQVFSANLSTWAVTAIGTALEFYTSSGLYLTAASLNDGKHFIAFWQKTGAGGGYAQVFQVNPSTFAVTTAGAEYLFDPDYTKNGNSYNGGLNNECVSLGDGKHFANFWTHREDRIIGISQVFEVNLSTFAITESGIKQVKIGQYFRARSILSSQYRVLVVYNTETTVPGNTSFQLLKLLGDPEYYNLLYAQQGNGDVLNWNGVSWVNVRSGLKTTQKARFSQFLNYLWMVNGNSYLGDPVATSNGGAFGTDLVPDYLPPGDSIQAGFEGKIWVMDSLADVVYYSDIVQFTPPNNYSLTFDPDVNYLKNFSSQDGDKMTALWQVPRALLLFKENHIYRIYGANSVDSYPAYNVGTFSQESIVETKDGIYFHHSSGFYKFDYGSQPVEISRRIIDFVKAIPSTYYSEIVGEWDGFDAVKWYVGPVTVEGVYYSNCVVRYTISTQVWTIYNYKDNEITAMIRFDDGDEINQIAGTSLGKVVSLDTGTTDLGKAIHYEIIDRWRSFTDMYAKSKSVSGMNVYTENGAGMRVEYQVEKTIPDKWTYIDTVNENYDALFPNASTDDFAVIRFRYTGQNSGVPIIFHGVELLSIQDKGFDQN